MGGTGGWWDRRTGFTLFTLTSHATLLSSTHKSTHTWTDGQTTTDRLIDRHTDRQMDGHTDKHPHTLTLLPFCCRDNLSSGLYEKSNTSSTSLAQLTSCATIAVRSFTVVDTSSVLLEGPPARPAYTTLMHC